MDLIDKGTHLEDAEGNRYAKSESHDKKRRKKRQCISPTDSDIIFGLWLEKAKKAIRLADIVKITGWTAQGLITHAKRHGFDDKCERILKASKPIQESVAIKTSMSERLAQGAEAHQASIDELMAQARKHFKKMRGVAILNRSKEIDTIDKVGRRLYGLDKEEQRAASAPVLNVAFLMGAGSAPVIVSTATGDDARRPDSQES